MVPPLGLSAAQGMTWLPLLYVTETRKATVLIQVSNAFFPASGRYNPSRQQLHTTSILHRCKRSSRDGGVGRLTVTAVMAPGHPVRRWR